MVEKDWQDEESESRLEMCRGCEDLCKVIQERRFENDSVTPRDPYKKVLHWWCRNYGLHLENIDHIIGSGYCEKGKGKYCRYFRN